MRRATGFTLIEVIIMITLSALVAAVVVPFLGTALTGSSEAVNQMAEAFEVNRAMANVLAEYRRRVARDDFDLIVFKNSHLTSVPANQDSGVTVTGTLIAFKQKSGNYEDYDGDGVYDPSAVDEGDPPDNALLLVTASRNLQRLRLVLGE